jgi:hypothetical protein
MYNKLSYINATFFKLEITIVVHQCLCEYTGTTRSSLIMPHLAILECGGACVIEFDAKIC